MTTTVFDIVDTAAELDISFVITTRVQVMNSVKSTSLSVCLSDVTVSV